MATPDNGIYVLQGIVPSQIAAAPVKVKVIDIYNDNGQLFSAAEVAQMEGGATPGTLLGYFSIGEAENYRSYWSSLPSSVLGPVDPNWPGDYLVKYWTDAWKTIATSYIDQMIARGYSGAYFDVVDVCESSWAKANAPNGDPKGAMISLITFLADYARAKTPGFKIWINSSGAEDLLTNLTLVNKIDGALEEELFYQDSGAPQKAADVAYNLNLLHNLTAAGKSVFAVEYVTGAAKVADIQAKAAAAGIGSYIANPNLELNGVDTEGFPTLSPPAPSDQTLNGGTGNDVLTGGSGNDTLNGAGGADTMTGGAGDDRYYVDNAGDVVVEAAGGGTDTVYTSASYALKAGSEVEVLRANAGATGLVLTGNELANTIVGGAGNDALNGGGGNDRLVGSGGSDTLAGGVGDDTYVVSDASDVVTEAAGEGNDTVMAAVSYTLAAGSEIEFLRANAGTAGLTLTGNTLANTVVGGGGNDVLNGGGGNDRLNGNGGNDILTGAAGNDTLTGGAGNDVFRFVGGFGSDVITDFGNGVNGSQDVIDLSGVGITAATFASSVTISGTTGTVMTVASFGTIRLSGVAPSTIDQTDFKLA